MLKVTLRLHFSVFKCSEQSSPHTVPVFMCPCADILHSSKPARHSGIGIELFHYGLSHSEVVGVASGLQTSKYNLTYMSYRISSSYP